MKVRLFAPTLASRRISTQVAAESFLTARTSRALFLAAFLVGTAPLAAHAQPGPASRPDTRVVVAETTRLSFPLTVQALGTAKANESVDIRAKLSETVTAIHFEEGQKVEAGDILLELENAPARAAVAAAAAEVADSKSKHVRARELFASSLVSSSEIESMEARHNADRAALDAAKARLADTVVRAPFSGRLGLRRISQGGLVTPATIITTLDDTDLIKLDFDIPETALSQIAIGLPIVGLSAAWPDERFDGEVTVIDTRVDPVTRTVTVRALVPNEDHLLRAGMFLTVELRKDDLSVLMVPEHALVPEQDRQFVMVVNAEELIEKREVKLGRRRPGQVEVLRGLEEGEVVVVEGTQKVKAGSKVEVTGRVEVTQ